MKPLTFVMRLFVVMAALILVTSITAYAGIQVHAGQSIPYAALNANPIPTSVAEKATAVATSIKAPVATSTAIPAPSGGSPAASKGNDIQMTTFVLDNMTIDVHTPFLPMVVPSDHPFTVSSPGSVTQDATASSPGPWSSLEIIAVPFGTRPATVNVPVAESGEVGAYLNALRAAGKPYEIAFDANGPVALLFGQQVVSQVTLLQLSLNTVDTHPTMVVQWVVVAGPRLWMVRIVEQLPDGTTDLSREAVFLKSLENLTLSSNNLDSPTTLIPTNPLGTPIAIVSPEVPGMPSTGVATSWNYDLRTLLAVLLGSLVILGGFYLRRLSGLNKKAE